MGLPKGKTNNPNGRPKGSGNKAVERLRQWVEDFTDRNSETIQEEFDNLESKDRVKYFLDMMQFVVPKVSSVQMKVENKEQPLFNTKPKHDINKISVQSNDSDTED